MDVYKIYANTGNHVARGSLLSDTVIKKILIILCFADSHKTYIIDSSAKRVFALDLLILGTNCAENRECSLDIVAQETIIWNVTGNSSFYLNLCAIESNVHHDFEGDIWLKKLRIRIA